MKTTTKTSSQSLCIALLLSACNKDDASPATERTSSEPAVEQSRPVDAPKEAGDELSTPPATAEPPIDPPRSNAASAVGGKAASHLGFSLDKLAGWYSVEGRPVVPSWAAPSEAKPELVRDDDLRTAWTCTAAGEQPCALGLAFSAPATLHAIRLYGAAGPEYNTYRANPRVKQIRIHTDAGWIDAKVDDGATHGYVVFEAPVETRTVAVEVLQTHSGKSKVVHLAELEALGSAGPRRPPLDLDPSATAVVFETEAWKEKGEGHTIRLAFLEVLRPDGTLQRLLRGTSLLGRKGDRFLLVEKLHGSRCSAFDGGYILLDQHTRMLYPLGTMGAVPGQVLRKDDGQGFAVRAATEDSGRFRAVVLEDDAAKIKYSPKQPERADKAQADWGFASGTALRRGGGHRLEDPPEACERAPIDEVAELFEGISAETVVRCDLDGVHAALVATEDACGRVWRAVVVDGSGEVVHRLVPKKSEGRGLRLARLEGMGLVLEASRDEGASADLFRMTPEGIALLAKGATLALRTPASCDPCDDRFAAERHQADAVVAALADGDSSAADPSETDGEDPHELPSVDDEDDDEDDADGRD